MVDHEAARQFVYRNARLLEQRVFAALFEAGPQDAVIECLRGFQNTDGGFGHGLEPDKCAPTSQPLDVEIAFERLVMVGANEPGMVESACDWLATVADAHGAVSVLLPSHVGYPRAAHWNQDNYPPDLNPTAAIVAHAHALGASHPWVDVATEHCFRELEAGRVPDEAHALLAVTKLLASAPDRDRANALAPTVAAALPAASFMNLDAASESYGLTPLEFAPSPSSFAAPWFSADNLQTHLQNLAHGQSDDGGWPIAWDPPSEPARYTFRAIMTLQALRTLAAYADAQQPGGE